MAGPRSSTTSTRDGFTLVEMLVATGVFVLGFVAVYSLFLSGMRFRKLADDTARTATLASTLLTEMYLDSDGAPSASVGPAAPTDYNGSGNPTMALETATGLNTPLYSYAGIPGTVYRFSGTTDLIGGSVASADTPDPTSLTTALVTQVFIACPGVSTPTLGDLNRSHLVQSTDPQPLYNNQTFGSLGPSDQAIALQQQMVAHGAAMQYTAVIIRQPHWLNQ